MKSYSFRHYFRHISFHQIRHACYFFENKMHIQIDHQLNEGIDSYIWRETRLGIKRQLRIPIRQEATHYIKSIH